jgi:multimeric flavodoxin WrbA
LDIWIDSSMKHLLLVYSSQSGHTETMMRAVREGVAEFTDVVELRILQALSAGIDDLLWAHGLLIGTPENFGYMSGAVKDFLDRTYYPAQGKVNGLPYAIFISAGNDGSGAARAIERIAQGYGWQKVAEPIVAKGELGSEALDQCRELGQTLAAGLALGIF